MRISAMVLALTVVVGPARRLGATPFPADVDFLLRVRRTLPNLITDAPEHGVDLQRLLVQRHRLLDKLKPYAREPRYVTIEIDDVGVRPLVRFETAPGAAAKLVATFRAVVDGLPRDAAAQRAALLARIRAELPRPSLDLVRFALWSLDQRDVPAGLAAFGERDLDAFRTQSAIKQRVRLLEEAIGWRHVDHRPGPFHEVRPRLREGLFDGSRTGVTHLRDRVVLAEMHPDLAVFKGIFGSDCTTRYCFGYPYAPLERIFAVLDERGDFLGYVGLTRTEVNRRAIYYVNCINGRRVGAHRTVMILKGLTHLLDDEVGALALPAFNALGDNFNFPEIRGALYKIIGSRPPERQRHLDAIPRYRIETETENHQSHYEAIYRNGEARVLPTRELAAIGFDVRVSEGSRFAALDPAPPNAREYVAAVLEAIAARQFQLARRLWFDLDGDARAIDLLTDQVTNVRHLPEEEFVASLASIVHAYGIPDAGAFLAAHPSIPAIGRLVAADAMAPGRRAKTICDLLDLLGRQRDRRTAGFWPALDAFLRNLGAEDRDELIARTLEARGRARRKIKNDLMYQLRPHEIYEDLLRLVGCEDALLRGSAE